MRKMPLLKITQNEMFVQIHVCASMTEIIWINLKYWVFSVDKTIHMIYNPLLDRLKKGAPADRL